MSSIKIVAQEIVEKGYFFPELPPPFTTKDFGAKYQKIFSKKVLEQLANQKPSVSECVYFAIPKAGYNRRIMGIPI